MHVWKTGQLTDGTRVGVRFGEGRLSTSKGFRQAQPPAKCRGAEGCENKSQNGTLKTRINADEHGNFSLRFPRRLALVRVPLHFGWERMTARGWKPRFDRLSARLLGEGNCPCGGV